MLKISYLVKLILLAVDPSGSLACYMDVFVVSSFEDGRMDMPQNGHSWSDGPTDPCTGDKKLCQASDGQPENIMPPAPKGGGIIIHVDYIKDNNQVT